MQEPMQVDVFTRCKFQDQRLAEIQASWIGHCIFGKFLVGARKARCVRRKEKVNPRISPMSALSNFAHAYAPAPSARPDTGPKRSLARRSVLGFSLVKASRAETAYWIADRAQSRTPTHIAFLNAHCANLTRRDWKYRDTLKTVDALLPDGSGVELAAKLDGRKLGENLNGTDLFAPLCRCLAFRKIPVFFLGGRPGIADATAVHARARFPGLQVAGARHGYFAPRDETAVLDEINRSGARVVFVAFGVPEQDVWLARVRQKLNAPVVIGVGGLFDFVSGRTPRAPAWMRSMGMEWVYRLRCEPARMWRRYLIGNVTFMANALAFATKRRMPVARRRMSAVLKRGLDVVAAGIGLALLSPFLLLTTLLIRLESPGSALFRQTRVGERGKLFTLLKFRSMRSDSDDARFKQTAANDREDGITFKLKADPRVTRIGAFIRKYSIDELPQLWNVLMGEMSLVGPRPALPAEVARYSPQARRRLAGKPGLTCTWQISGRADLPFDRQVKLDVAYLGSRSFWRDVAILARTPIAVISARGAY